MTSVLGDLQALRETICAEELAVGIRPDGHVSEGVVRRRRRQLFLVGAIVLLGLAASAAAGDLWDSNFNVLDARIIQIAMILLTVAVAVFLLEKDAHLKRLDQIARLIHDRDLEVARRLLRSAAVADAGRGVGTTLDLEQVITRMLDRALELVGAEGAWLYLVTGDGSLREAGGRSANHHSDAVRPAGIDELVARSWVTKVAAAGAPTSPRSMAVPVVADGERLGVLVVSSPEVELAAEDLEVLSRFVAVSGPAVHNARVHEATVVALERARLADQMVVAEMSERVEALRDGLDRFAQARDEIGRDEALHNLRNQVARLETVSR